MKIDKSALMPALENFNKTYGCQFDIEKYEEALDATEKEKTSEKINKVFQDMFADIYLESLKSAAEGKIAPASGTKILNDLDDKIVFPLIRVKRKNGYRPTAMPSARGGMGQRARQELMNTIEAQAPVVEEQPKQFNLNKLTPAIEKFNKTYGCKFNANKYVAELDKFKEDLDSERRDNLYQEVFRNLYKEALKSMNSKKIDAFDAEDILYDFEDDIISPLFEMREKSGIKEDTQEYGGISYQQRQEFYKEHENRIAKLSPTVVIQRGNKEYDINKFQNAVNEFNTTYGCQLDIKKYADALVKAREALAINPLNLVALDRAGTSIALMIESGALLSDNSFA